MLDMAFIIGVTMATVEIIKKRFGFPKKYLFIPVLGIAAGLNALNAFFFNEVLMIDAVQEGLYYGALASGIYGLGKELIQKRKDELEQE